MDKDFEDIPVYESSDDDEVEACLLCNQTDDNQILFGEKLSSKGITAHLFCMLFSANLVQTESDDNGFRGFVPETIEKKCLVVVNW